jgi:hypothetical protein
VFPRGRGRREPDIEERIDGSRGGHRGGLPTFLGGRCEIHYVIAVRDGCAVELSTSSDALNVRGRGQSG